MIQCFVWYCTRILESDCTNRPYLMSNFRFCCDGVLEYTDFHFCGMSVWSKWEKSFKIILYVCTQVQLRLKTKNASVWTHEVKSLDLFARLSCSSHLELFYPDKCLYCRLQGVAQQSQTAAKWLWLSQGFPCLHRSLSNLVKLIFIFSEFDKMKDHITHVSFILFFFSPVILSRMKVWTLIRHKLKHLCDGAGPLIWNKENYTKKTIEEGIILYTIFRPSVI